MVSVRAIYRRFCEWRAECLRRRAADLSAVVAGCLLLRLQGAPDLPAGEIDAAEREIAGMRARADVWERRSMIDEG